MVAGGLFAEISFSGSAQTGMMVAIEDDITFHVRNQPGNWNKDYMFDLGVSGTNASGNAGGDGGFTKNADGAGFGATVWFKPLDILKVTAGDVSIWWKFGVPGSAGSNNDNDVGVGALFELAPLSGLDILAGVYPAGLDFGKARYTAGVKYGADIFSTGANISYDGAGNNGTGFVKAAAGVGVSALKGMGIKNIAVNVVANNLTQLAQEGSVTVGPLVEVGFGALNARARANLYIPVRDSGPQDLDLRAGVDGSYPITDTITAAIGVGYELKGSVGSTNGQAFSWQVDWGGGDEGPAAFSGQGLSGEDSSVLGIRPSLAIQLAGGTLNLGYALATQIGGSNGSTKHGIYTFYKVEF